MQDNGKDTTTQQSSRFSGKLNALAFHVILGLSVSAGSYFVLQQMAESFAVHRTQAVGQQVATLIELQAASWQAQTALLAQQPDLKTPAILKAVIPVDGTVPPSLSYTIQDLLNRTKVAATQPELVMSDDKTIKVNTATAMTSGGYLVAEWPFTPLQNALQTALPTDYQLKLSQSVNGQAMELLRIHGNGNDGVLRPTATKLNGWDLAVGPTRSTDMPLWAALFSLIAGLITMTPWLLLRRPVVIQQAPLIKTKSTNDSNPLDQNSVAGSLDQPLPSTALDKLPIVPVITPASAKMPATDHNDARLDADESNKTASDTATPATPTPTPTASTPAEPEKPASNLMEFNLDEFMLPELQLGDASEKKFPSHLFRAYDIRGPVTDMPAELVSHIGKALGSILRDNNQHQVVLGYDVRLTSEDFNVLIRDALVSCGLTVIEIGQVPTPIMHHAAREHDGNGIMISASHCDGGQNGFKWVIENHPPTPEEIQQVQVRCMEQNFIEGHGQSRIQSYTESYLDHLLADVILNQSFEVAIDGMNGAMGPTALSALRAVGCQVSSINTEPDGNFPHGDPDPSQAGRLDDLCNDVIITGADIGFAFDGDGDRLVVIDPEGQVVSPDQLIALFAMMVLEAQPGSDIVFDVKCSRMISTMITQSGGRPVMVRSGNTFIRQALQSSRYEASFGAEFSGHYFFNDGRGHNNDDGLYAALRLLEWLALRGQTLTEVLKTLPQRVGTPDMYLPLDGRDGRQLLADIETAAEHMHDSQVSLLDGVRLDFNDGFGIIRASNTGPYLTARFDGDDPEALQRIRKVFYDLVAPSHPDMARRLTE